MKNVLLLILLFTLFSCNNSNEIVLLKNGESSFAIFTSADDSASRTAAAELQHFLNAMGGLEFPINPKDFKGKKLIIQNGFNPEDSLLAKLKDRKSDFFFHSFEDDRILLAGGNDRATLYAAYTFLQNLGCMLFPDGEEFIPQAEELVLLKGVREFEPDFSFRQTSLYRKTDKRYETWHRVRPHEAIFGMFVHTFQHLMPPAKYFKDHPEYYGFYNGRRNYESQLCLSNEEMYHELAKNLRTKMEEKPEMEVWSVSQNDYYNYCECEDCKRKYEKYDSYSGAYIEFMNRLALEFPEKQISTLAYQFTRSAPKNIVPEKNVNIMFCSIECNRSMPLAEDRRSNAFVQDMKDWSALTHNIFVWDYVVQFQNFLCPFPNFDVLQPNIRFFKDHGVDMLFSQGSGANWSDFEELKFYLIAQMSWNSKANQDSLIHQFMPSYYGPAAPIILEYYQLMQESLNSQRDSAWLDIYGFPSLYAQTFLTQSNLEKAMMLFDSAETLLHGDSIHLKRVWKTRISPDFAYIDLAFNQKLGDISFMDQQDGKAVLNETLVAKLNQMVDRGKIVGVNYVNEKVYSLSEYRDYTLRKAELQLQENKLDQAEVKLLTNPSEIYQVGGVSALNDRRLGGLHFRYNWLGFQGEDFICEIQFPQNESIEQVKMNFLTDVVSWVFLPEQVVLYGSMDGKKYQKLDEIKLESSGPEWRIATIPVNLQAGGTAWKFLKVHAESIRICPDWHRGQGNPSWIFIDELVVE